VPKYICPSKAYSYTYYYTQFAYSGRRGKGKRGGLRVIYFYWVGGLEFWLFTLYDKNELSDLAKKDLATLES